jgi:hypothetical protein
MSDEMDRREVEEGVGNVCSDHENCEDTNADKEELGQLNQSPVCYIYVSDGYIYIPSRKMERTLT